MKLKSVEIESYTAIDYDRLPLDAALTLLHRATTSVLNAVAVGLRVIPDLLSAVSEIDSRDRPPERGRLCTSS